MEILDKYPQSKAEFLSFIMEKYGIQEYDFNNGSFDLQCRAIWSFLGHSKADKSKMAIELLSEQTQKYLYDYEDVLRRYPGGTPNYIKIIGKLSFNELEKIVGTELQQREILPGLNASIVPIVKDYTMEDKHFPSLRDALQALAKPIEQKISDSEFWNNIMTNQRKNEDCPF